MIYEQPMDRVYAPAPFFPCVRCDRNVNYRQAVHVRLASADGPAYDTVGFGHANCEKAPRRHVSFYRLAALAVPDEPADDPLTT